MEEPRGYNSGNSADEYRTVKALVRDGNYREALERAARAIQTAGLGRKHMAKLHSLSCWLLTEPLQQSGPQAVLFGEEALRLADLVNDEWIRADALARLITAYCHVGDLNRARAAAHRLESELNRNPAALDGGRATFWTLRAGILSTAGLDEPALRALERAEAEVEPHAVHYHTLLPALLLQTLVCLGRCDEAGGLIDRHRTAPVGDAELEWQLGKVWLTFRQAGATAARPQLEALIDRARTAGLIGLEARTTMLLAQSLGPEQGDRGYALRARAISLALSAGRMDLAMRLKRMAAQAG